MKAMTLEQIIEKFKTDDNHIKYGIDTAMESIRPLCLYEIECCNGEFKITRWDEGQYEGPPTPQEIRDEYIRHQTISECYEYFKEKH